MAVRLVVTFHAAPGKGPGRRSPAAAAYHPLSICTSGGRVAVGTRLDGPVRADPPAGAVQAATRVSAPGDRQGVCGESPLR
jgi:hypothetical protein